MIKLRWIEKNDLEDVLRVEHAQYSFHDPDFDVQSLQPWGWSALRWMAAVTQRRNAAIGTWDTRALVAEETETGEILGAVCYEIQKDCYEIIHLVAHPNAPEKVRRCLLSIPIERAWGSDRRQKVVFHVPDGDWTNLKCLMGLGWAVKHENEFFEDGNDAWCCVYDAKNKAQTRGLDASYA